MAKCKIKAIQTNLGTFKHNQTYPGIIQAYSGIFRTLCSVMPTHPHQAGATRILKASPSYQKSYLLARTTLPKVVIKSIDIMTLNIAVVT